MGQAYYSGQETFQALPIDHPDKAYAKSVLLLWVLGLRNIPEANAILHATAEELDVTRQLHLSTPRTVRECFVRAAFQVLSGGALKVEESPTFPNLLIPEEERFQSQERVEVPSLTPGKTYWLIHDAGVMGTIPIVEFGIQIPGGTMVSWWYTSPEYVGKIDPDTMKMQCAWYKIVTTFNSIDPSLGRRRIFPDTPTPMTPQDILRLPRE